MLSKLVAFIACLPGLVIAGTATITDAGARNVGSSAAYVASCEKEGFIRSGTLADFLAALKSGLLPAHWEKVKNQYQLSLHDKRQYSIAKDKWMPFRLNGENCEDLAKALPLIRTAIKRNSG